jgi:hypothetical protein
MTKKDVRQPSRKENLKIPDLPELAEFITEASQQVEQELSLEDSGWINLSNAKDTINATSRKSYVLQSRLYEAKDPLAKQAIRLWVDYTFGTGMEWSCESERVTAVLDSFYNSPLNSKVLSPRGQRRCTKKLLIDGELFYAIFLSRAGSTIRLIDPLEITEIITDTDDSDNEMYYKREWTDNQGKQHTNYYASYTNIKNAPAKTSTGDTISGGEKGVVVYRFPLDNTSQRGLPLLLPALDWIKQYRRFLASRVAIMLALTRFAWKNKVKGGSAAVASVKAVLDNQQVPAGSMIFENEANNMQPIKTDTGSANAYQDGRMLKLQVAAATGIPEQYFGDISIGNLATAKTVELPMMKMFQSFQSVCAGAYDDIDRIILDYYGVKYEHIDRDFPAIAPEDTASMAIALGQILTVMPELGTLNDVKQVALLALGINDTGEVLEQLTPEESQRMVEVKVAEALRKLERVIKEYR